MFLVVKGTMLNAVGASSRVCPSGVARATDALPMTPPPPVRFSTMALCLNSFCSTSPASRPRMSVVPPGVNGTTMVIGPDGYCCANAAPDNIVRSRVVPINRAAMVISTSVNASIELLAHVFAEEANELADVLVTPALRHRGRQRRQHAGRQ